MASNKWFVITGGPSTGKTTLLAGLEMAGYKTIPEAARTLIDEALAKGFTMEEFRADEKRFQNDVTYLKREIEAGLDPDVVTFLDRGMHDTVAYMRYYKYYAEDRVQELMRESSYRKVFLLDPLSIYQQDYARTEGAEFVHGINILLHEAYAEHGMEPIGVPAMELNDRVKFILDNIEEE